MCGQYMPGGRGFEWGSYMAFVLTFGRKSYRESHFGKDKLSLLNIASHIHTKNGSLLGRTGPVDLVTSRCKGF